MKHLESQPAGEKLVQIKSKFSVDVLSDWGEADGKWNDGSWSITELDKLDHALSVVSDCMGGAEKFIRHLGGVTVKKSDIGSHGGEALQHQVSLSTKGTFSSWTVAHEMAHAWDANHGWKLSVIFERYTGGYTSQFFSRIKKTLGPSDAGPQGEENIPGRHGRLRGCNKAGYFYGDIPSGSNWNFNRKEDFAESVAMYIGWGRDNDLSQWAEGRIKRYLLDNGASDRNFGVENWADYKKYFYPESGDYAMTKRWKFIDELVNDKIDIT